MQPGGKIDRNKLKNIGNLLIIKTFHGKVKHIQEIQHKTVFFYPILTLFIETISMSQMNNFSLIIFIAKLFN